jgi:hypothetical protein
MDIRFVIAPMIAQALMTLCILFLLAYRRYQAVKAKEVKVLNEAASQYEWPRFAAQTQRSFLNQFETPVLFYALVPLVILTKTYDTLFVVLAWTWFASRLGHAWVHCTNNALSLRFPLFLVGVILLVAMWIMFAIRLAA